MTKEYYSFDRYTATLRFIQWHGAVDLRQVTMYCKYSHPLEFTRIFYFMARLS